MTVMNENVSEKGEHIRGAGILLPVGSLPGLGVNGEIGKEAYRFVDFLRESGQRYWQILPLCPTDTAHSPYQSPAAFAGNYELISMELLCEEGLLNKEDCAALYADKGSESRLSLLRKAYSRFQVCDEYISFCDNNIFWLDDYAMFMSLKEHFNGDVWQKWNIDIRDRQDSAMEKYRRILSDDMDFWRFVQFVFSRQWQALKRYANESGIEIIGDIPLYVSGDSVDCWAHRDHFLLDTVGYPAYVGGVPPDGFSEDGQNWGMPVYAWERHISDGFCWWKERMTRVSELYDLIRMDHFIGISKYYLIPGVDAHPADGAWNIGPGEELLKAITQVISAECLIAEDLGIRNPETDRLLQAFGIPGMKVLEFAFDGNPENSNLPHCYNEKCVVYGGTHDNEPLAAFFKAHSWERGCAARYMELTDEDNLTWPTIRLGMSSMASFAIFQIQDYLELGIEARINTPGTVGEHNWTWRLDENLLTSELAKKIRETTRLYGR